jgi:methylglyoxal synthase
MVSEPMGFDAQIIAKIAEGKTKMVFLFIVYHISRPGEVIINMLIRVCNIHPISLTTDEATIQMVLHVID